MADVLVRPGLHSRSPLRRVTGQRQPWAGGPYILSNRADGRFCGFNLSGTGRSPGRERRHRSAWRRMSGLGLIRTPEPTAAGGWRGWRSGWCKGGESCRAVGAQI